MVFCSILAGILYAQAPDTLWMKIYGGSNDDYGNGICETVDGGYIATGMNSSSGAGDLYVVRTDAQGDSLWTGFFGGPYWDHGYAIYQTADRGFISSGYSCSYTPDHNEDFMLVKMDSLGNQQWVRHYGGDSLDVSYGLALTPDNGYIMTGRTYSFGNGQADIYCVKVQENGDTVWTRTYGGPLDEGSFGITARSDSCFVICGHTSSWGAGHSDVYLLCIDSNGDTLWTRIYGGIGYDFAYGITPTSDNGYVIIGKSRSFGTGSWDIYLIKVDHNGDSVWTRVYQGMLDDVGNCVRETYDGDLIMTGYTMNHGTGNTDMYIIKADAQGDTIWTKVVGGYYEDIGRCIIQTSDSAYVICGLTNSFGSGGFNYMLVKLAPESSGVCERSWASLSDNMLLVIPNPARWKCMFEIHDCDAQARLCILNITGQCVKSFLLNDCDSPGPCRVAWDGRDQKGNMVPSGVYFAELLTGSIAARQKIILTH